MTATCLECNREFPPMLLQPLFTERGSRVMCPICALRERNTHAGLPLDTPFKGTTARNLYQMALEHVAKSRKEPPR